MSDRGAIRAGMGGWIFEPWEETFYPKDLPKRRQLEYASRQVSTIEINATYYRGQSPATFARWAEEAPADFVFSMKGNRFVTNRKVLGEAAESIFRFFEQDVGALGPKLGPVVWQFAPTKKFDAADFEAFLRLLPKETGGYRLRHALEVRHESFAVPEFVDLAGRYGVGIVFADHFDYPAIADVTADFVYLRLQKGDDGIPAAYPDHDLRRWAQIAASFAEGGVPVGLPVIAPQRHVAKIPRDVFVYFIHEGKARAPHAAIAFLDLVS